MYFKLIILYSDKFAKYKLSIHKNSIFFSYINSSSAKTSDLIAPHTFDEIKSNGLGSPVITGLLNKYSNSIGLILCA